MAYELKMPQLGLTMEEGTLSKWLKHEGDTVKAGEVVAEITTDKLTNELTSEQDGVVLKLVAQEGDDIPVKGTLAWIGQAGEAVPGAVPAAVAAAVPQAPAAPAAAPAGGKKSVIVIGGGPGGYVAAIRAAQLGAEVTVVEKQYLGGTCLNVGCIPTKCLLHSAELVEQIKTQGKDIGVEVEGVKVNFPQVIAHKNAISKQLTSGVAGLLKMNKVKKVDGTAKFTGEKQLEVTKADGSKETMTADAIIVATGSVNAQPPIPGLKENPNCIDSTGALSLEKLPQTMVVIGGGVIGLELACAYAAFGTKITVVEAMDHMLPMLDGDLTKIGVAHMKKMGMDFHLECPVQSVESSPVGAKVVCKDKSGKTVSFEAEKVLVAIGRKANTAGLDLAAGKIDNDKGRILVNDKMETNVPGVYAIGDVSAAVQLAHVAAAQGTDCVERMCGGKGSMDLNVIPSCIYSAPEIAVVGLTEAEAKEQGIPAVSGKCTLFSNARTIIEDPGRCFMKLVARSDTREIIGAQLMCQHASDMISQLSTAMVNHLTARQLLSVMRPHPSFEEALSEAVENLTAKLA